MKEPAAGTVGTHTAAPAPVLLTFPTLASGPP